MRRLIPLLLLAAPAWSGAWSQAVVPSPREKARYDGCVAAIGADAAKAAEFAAEWQVLGGGLPARHCLGLAQLALGKPALAAATLARAAQAAEAARERWAAELWAQAGNAALLAGDNGGALRSLGSALAAAGDRPPNQRADWHVDRARAAVAAGDARLARADLDRATALDAGDADAWLLSAALARRDRDLDRAATDIARALALAPKDADVLLEAGHVAAALGEAASARRAWTAAAKLGAGTPAGEAAGAALAGRGS